MRKEQLLNIYEDNGLYGAKDQNGQIVITAQYTEMYQFSCGLSLVRNSQYQYAYIDYDNNIVIPFGGKSSVSCPLKPSDSAPLC